MTDRIKTWTEGVFVEPTAMAQVEKMASLPFVFRHVAVLPDCHAGKGSVVGSVIPTIGALVPACLGVDLSCSMSWTRTTLTADQLPADLHPLRLAIEAVVPHGRTNDGGPCDAGAWSTVPDVVRATWERDLEGTYRGLVARVPELAHRRPLEQLGTLGTGNHFCEIVIDDDDRVGVMLHSGSRGPGARIAAVYMARAKEHCKKYFVNLPDPDLAYLPEGTDDFDGYVRAIHWAADYAAASHRLMNGAAIAALSSFVPAFTEDPVVYCSHNYAAKERHFGQEVWVTRKGACRALETDVVIIPGSMGAKSFICRGKGNRDSFTSCSHGAGRAMSRTEAKRRFTVADHEAATAGVECRKDSSVIDETPGSYKSIADVMNAQTELVEVLHTVKGVLCVKG
jgi:tRNA-splicing ligase RtcB (3'-phosphate/5'-hydroxy nucleic acid ligase)